MCHHTSLNVAHVMWPFLIKRLQTQYPSEDSVPCEASTCIGSYARGRMSQPRQLMRKKMEAVRGGRR